jgi:pimeloyl-ACP methyl ester carboxylesterase
MKSFLNLNKGVLRGLQKIKLTQSPVFWQQFAVVILIIAVVLPATLQAKTPVVPATKETTQMTTFIVERYTKKSNQPSLIFIPGLLSNASVYNGIKEQFVGQFDVHLVTIKGFAGTPQDGEFNFDQLLQDLQTYITLKKLNRPHIVGHSMGGLIGLTMAAEQENIIGKVVSVDGLPFIGPIFTRNNETQVSHLEPQALAMKKMFESMTPEQLAAQTKRGIFIQAKASEDQAHIIAMAHSSDPVTAGEAMYEVMTRDIRQALQESQTEILMLGASGAFTQEAQHLSAQNLYESQFDKVKNAKVTMTRHARHFIMYDQPAWLVKQISSFLEK